MSKKEELNEIMETIGRHPGYDLDCVIRKLRKIDPSDPFIQNAIEHIRGANGKGSFYKHDTLQNLSWARREITNYINELL